MERGEFLEGDAEFEHRKKEPRERVNFREGLRLEPAVVLQRATFLMGNVGSRDLEKSRGVGVGAVGRGGVTRDK